MKRDLELIRKIMIEIEKSPSFFSNKISIDNYDDKIITAHIVLLEEGGYVYANTKNKGLTNPNYSICRLTWKGYEFLELSRNEKRWEEVLKLIKDKALTVPFDLLTELLKEAGKSVFGLE